MKFLISKKEFTRTRIHQIRAILAVYIIDKRQQNRTLDSHNTVSCILIIVSAREYSQ